MEPYNHQSKEIQQNRRRSIFRLDVLLLTFLLIGWTLIFATATLGLQRDEQVWLGVGLTTFGAADYSPAPTEAPRLARIQPESIEAVRRDQLLRATPSNTSPTLLTTPTPTVTPPTTLDRLEVNVGGPYNGDEGSAIIVTAESDSTFLGSVPGMIIYRWDTDDDGEYDDAEGASTSVLFYDEGQYTVKVEVTNWLGQSGSASAIVKVSNVSPLIQMGSDVRANESQEVAFSATVSDPGHDVLQYEWDFGDGSPRLTDTLTPRHRYSDNGDFVVRLRVRDNDGGVSEASLLAGIKNLPPLVEAGLDQVSNEGVLVTFTGKATDPGEFDELNYAWDLDYDGLNFNMDATGQTVSTTYPDGPKVFLAALRVTDKDGEQTIDTVKTTVKNVSPVIAGVTNNGPAGEGLPLALTVQASDVPDDPLTYAFDWNNDGKFEVIDKLNTVSKIWLNQGDYPVRIRVDDGDGGEAFASTTVSALNSPPVAVVNVSGSALEGTAVSFDASDSNDPGTNDILTYQWNFGDGNSAAGVNVSHAYADNSVYSATLTVLDDSGESSTAAAAVTILNANPTAEAGPDQTVDEGTNISLVFAGVTSDPGSADQLDIAWNFDYQAGTFTPEVTGAAGTYVFPSLDGPFERTVALRVRDDDYPASSSGGGEIGEALDTLRLTVRNLSPWNVRAGGPYSGLEADRIMLMGTAEDVPADTPTLTYAWDLDSNPLTFEVSGNPVSRVWNRAGAYDIRLRVTDKDGGESFASARVDIGNAPPTAEANGPYTTTVTTPITLTAVGSSDPIGEALTYQWNFGDGTLSAVTTNTVVTHVYTDDGVYSATLWVTDSRGASDTEAAQVYVQNLPPTAVASANPTTADKNTPVDFSAAGSGDPDDPLAVLNYQWDFGDGNGANGSSVAHQFGRGGVYTVTLTVTDDNSASDTAEVVITINNDPPLAAAGPDQTVFEGDTINFDGSSSSDPNGDSLTYEWDFNYDGINFEVDGTGAQVSYQYPDGPANVTVALRVSDGDVNGVAVDTLQVTVENVVPLAEAGLDQIVLEGSQVNFDGSASSDPGSGDILTYEWDFNYDGTNFGVDGSGPQVSHTYADGPANVTVALRVSDGQGGIGLDTLQITVNNADPTAVATADQTVVTVGQTVNFDGSGSSDPGSNDTLSYQWDFEYDGSIFNHDATGSGVTNTWTITGTYTIMLRVEDNTGGFGTDTITLQVNDVP